MRVLQRFGENTKNQEKYWFTKREAEKAVSEARLKAFEGFLSNFRNQEWRTTNI